MKNKKIVIKHSFFLLLSLCCFLFFSISVTATGAGGNADADSGGGATQEVVGGPGWQKTGWLVYIIDEAGNQLTDTKVFYSSSTEPPANCITYPNTKFGGSTNGYTGGLVPDWSPKPPFNDGGGANGIAVKANMLLNKNLLKFVEKHWGVGQLEAFISEKHFLIMEAFYWGQLYNGNRPTGRYLCATAHGWAHYQSLLNLGDYGSPRINRYTNNTYPNCVKLEFPQFGYTPAYGKLTNAQIMAGGNGFLALWANEDIEIEDMEERDELKQLYAIKNCFLTFLIIFLKMYLQLTRDVV